MRHRYNSYFGHKLIRHCKAKLEYFAFISCVKLLERYSLDEASDLCAKIARNLGPYYKGSRIAYDNLCFAFPEKAPEEIECLLQGMWDNLGRVVAEYCHIETLIKESATRIKVYGEEWLPPADQPAIFVSAHVGNWEVASIAIAQTKVKFTQTYRAANNKKVNDVIRQKQYQVTPNLIAKGPTAAREIMQALQRGSHVFMMVDQKSHNGLSIPFFERPALTAPGAARLAMHFNCPLIPVHVERQINNDSSSPNNNLSQEETLHYKGSFFNVHFESPIFLPPHNAKITKIEKEAAIFTAMKQINQAIEKWIANHPAHWLWVHRRW